MITDRICHHLRRGIRNGGNARRTGHTQTLPDTSHRSTGPGLCTLTLWLHAVALSRRAQRSLLPWAHRARRAVCVLGRSALLSAQHRACGSITAATTSFQAVLHTSTCTESAIAVARITMIRCLPHGRFCQLRVPASRTTLHARRHPCYTHSRHYTPPRLRPSPHAAALSLPLPHGTASPLTHAATRCHRHAATLVVIATRGRSLAAIATRRHMAASGAMLHAHGLLIARVFLSTRRSFVAPCRPPSTAAGGTLANPGLTSIAGRSGRSA